MIHTPKWRGALIVVAFAVLTVTTHAQDLAQKVDAYLAAEAQAADFSGVVLVRQGPTVIARKAFGFADREWQIANTPETKFRIGSITKPITATAIMQLQDEKKLSIDDPITKYVNGPDAWKPIKIRHLLTHTSGISSYTDWPEFAVEMVLTRPNSQMLALISERPLDFEPGKRFKYSNSGYYLLGLIIEKVVNDDYEHYMKLKFFPTAGMKSSGYDVSAAIIPQRAHGYMMTESGEVANASYVDMSQPYAAGGLYSTVDDLLAFVDALKSEKLLKKETFEAQTKAEKSNYALGWGVGRPGGHPIVSHSGGINGFTSNIAWYPLDDLVVIVLSNFEHAMVPRIDQNLAKIVFGMPYDTPVARKAITLAPKALQEFTGEYVFSPTFTITVRLKNDRLTTQATNQPELPIFAESESKFFLKVVNAQIEFKRNDKGVVESMILHQNGADMTGTKK